MIFVVFAWVPFRASSLKSAVALWKAMLRFHGGGLAAHAVGLTWVIALIAIALALPNTMEIFTHKGEMTPPARYTWKPTAQWAVFGGLAFGASLAAILGGQPTTFLYFRF
ncbi:hypothetical protein [Bradyrhizobium sp. dw_78]|uniref:hypothetical protein n=1 Tax=Bradyrhizobium sp. dw_78 TaxID=2719793 RepID=UPI00201BC710|nr:hypothetical protein [Bradyrhizobium sp. dw_78]